MPRTIPGFKPSGPLGAKTDSQRGFRNRGFRKGGNDADTRGSFIANHMSRERRFDRIASKRCIMIHDQFAAVSTCTYSKRLTIALQNLVHTLQLRAPQSCKYAIGYDHQCGWYRPDVAVPQMMNVKLNGLCYEVSTSQDLQRLKLTIYVCSIIDALEKHAQTTCSGHRSSRVSSGT